MNLSPLSSLLAAVLVLCLVELMVAKAWSLEEVS